MNSSGNLLTALVVEDSLVTQKLIMIFLKRIGFDVTLIDNGVDAIKTLKDNHFDVVFLDVIMPKIDGYCVCKFIKSSSLTKSIPVIMLTSKNGMFHKVRGKMSGADVYLVKPINRHDLVSAINKFYPVSNGTLDINYDPLQFPKNNNAKKPSYAPIQIQSNKTKEESPNKDKVLSLVEKIKQARINNKKYNK